MFLGQTTTDVRGAWVCSGDVYSSTAFACERTSRGQTAVRCEVRFRLYYSEEEASDVPPPSQAALPAE